VEEVERELKAALEAAGFTVAEGKVEGFSGYLHEFSFAVEGKGVWGLRLPDARRTFSFTRRAR